MALKRKGKTSKVRHQGPSAWEGQRGPNFGAWQKLYTNWAPGARSKYSKDWNSGYNGPGKGTW